MNKSMSITNTEKLNTLKNLLEKSRGSIHKVLPSTMSPDRMIKIATVGASRNPLLLQCDPLSVLKALMESSQLGLEPFTGLQQAYIIPYRNNKTGTYEAQFMPSYRGLIDLARRSGNIVSICANIVYDGDTFEVEYGLTPKLRHIPCFDGKSRGQMKLVYAVAILKDGGQQFEIMTKSDIEEVRASSKAANNGPWVSHYTEMCRKSVIRRLAKYLPMSVELSKALTADAKNDNDDVFDVDAIEIEDIETTVKPSATESLLNRLESEDKKV